MLQYIKQGLFQSPQNLFWLELRLQMRTQFPTLQWRWLKIVTKPCWEDTIPLSIFSLSGQLSPLDGKSWPVVIGICTSLDYPFYNLLYFFFKRFHTIFHIHLFITYKPLSNVLTAPQLLHQYSCTISGHQYMGSPLFVVIIASGNHLVLY